MGVPSCVFLILKTLIFRAFIRVRFLKLQRRWRVLQIEGMCEGVRQPAKHLRPGGGVGGVVLNSAALRAAADDLSI